MKKPDKNITSVLNYFHENLDERYTSNEVQSFFWILLVHELNYTRLDFMKDPELKISESEWLVFMDYSRRLANFEPVQYIAGETDFLGLKIKVDPTVLIPRPETEELVGWVLKSLTAKEGLEIIDIGTGSGCIALGLKSSLPKSYVTGVDIQRKALDTAILNGAKNNLHVDWELMDALNLPRVVEKYDVIVSNPPYVLEQEKSLMADNVLKFEPHSALFVDDEDPLLFYESIAHWAINSLKKQGLLFFEINEKYTDLLLQMLKDLGFQEAQMKLDIFDKPRMIRAMK